MKKVIIVLACIAIIPVYIVAWAVYDSSDQLNLPTKILIYSLSVIATVAIGMIIQLIIKEFRN